MSMNPTTQAWEPAKKSFIIHLACAQRIVPSHWIWQKGAKRFAFFRTGVMGVAVNRGVVRRARVIAITASAEAALGVFKRNFLWGL
jgi:hypothetical protein